MLLKTFSTRHTFFSYAVNYHFGGKKLSGRKAADCYAQLLSFKNSSELNNDLKKKKEEAIRKLQKDWKPNDPHVLGVLSEYIPDITSLDIQTIDELSQPEWSRTDKDWITSVKKLLSKVEDLRQLRYCAQHLKESWKGDIPRLLLNLSTDNNLISQARPLNRLEIIMSLLVELLNSKKIDVFTLQDVCCLYEPLNFSFLCDRIYHFESPKTGNRAINAIDIDGFALDNLRRRTDRDQFNMEGYDIATKAMNTLFKELGVNIEDSTLSHSLDQYLFGQYGGLNDYSEMQKSFRNGK